MPRFNYIALDARGQESTGFNNNFTVIARQATGDILPIGLCEYGNDFERAKIARDK